MSGGKVCVHLICIFSTLVFHQVYSRKIYAYFETFECVYYNPSYGDGKCWLSPDNRGQLAMNAILLLKRDLPTINVKYRFIIGRKDKNITYLNVDVDVCEALGAVYKNPLMRLLSEEIRRTSNFPIGCPLKKGVEYVINNFTINQKYIPPFTPLMTWMTNAIFYTNSSEREILTVDSSGKVDTKMKKNTTNKIG